MPMLSCQICNVNPQTALLTKCCKLFICVQCKNQYQKFQNCICGKAIIKRLCNQNKTLFQIFQQFQFQKPVQCDRCNEQASFTCKNCKMIFCKTCNQQVHIGLGYSKHTRQIFLAGKQPLKIFQHLQKKQDVCSTHKLIVQWICECGAALCSLCQKNHKQSCKSSGKGKSNKQFKQEYFQQIYIKLKKISQCKQKLINHKQQYINHFEQQKIRFTICKTAIQDQLNGLKKILQIKTNQIKSSMKLYWTNCQQTYQKILYFADYNQKQFDYFGRIIQKFAEHQVGIDYLDKRIKTVKLPYDFIQFKAININEIQSSIINLSTVQKRWDFNFNQALFNSDETEDKKVISKNNQPSFQLSNPQVLLQYIKNPLKPRPISLRSSHNQINFQFLHLPYQNDTYEVQYGVGFKMKGNEVFKKILNKQGKGTILNLNSSTKYRIHMRVTGGQWGDIHEIKTLDTPKLAIQNTNYSKVINDHTFNFLKQGIIYGTNQIYFGKISWSITINSEIISYQESHTACLSIGVANKQQKKPVFVGSTLNYGYQRQTITIKVQVNCEEETMTISNSLNSQTQSFHNLPDFPFFTAIQNKSNDSVHIKYSFQE